MTGEERTNFKSEKESQDSGTGYFFNPFVLVYTKIE